MLRFPEVAYRSCADCRKFVFKDEPTPSGTWTFGEQVFLPDAMRRFTLPVLRPKNQAPPCGHCPKVPKDAPPVPESAVELGPREWAAYKHYLKCKAVHRWPADPIVEQDAAIIRSVEDAHALAASAAVGHKLDGLVQVMMAVLKVS